MSAVPETIELYSRILTTSFATESIINNEAALTSQITNPFSAMSAFVTTIELNSILGVEQI